VKPEQEVEPGLTALFLEQRAEIANPFRGVFQNFHPASAFLAAAGKQALAVALVAVLPELIAEVLLMDVFEYHSQSAPFFAVAC
jgi:hypothetical protein